MKFKIGDKVKVRNDRKDEDVRSRLNDYEADMMSMLAERDIEGKVYDRISDAIEHGKPWKIIAIKDDKFGDGLVTYGTKLIGTKIECPWMFEEDDLEPYPE